MEDDKDKQKNFEKGEEHGSLLKEGFIFIWEIIKVVVISLAIILPIRFFLIQPFIVNGASMEPNFRDHEYLMVDQISYRFHNPQRGDVVIFRYPKDPRKFFIKRVIGLPGEEVMARNKEIIIYNDEHPKGIILEEKYVREAVESNGTVKIIAGEEEYVVLGDNRSESLDSRIFGPIHRKNIIGRAIFRGWPINKIDFLLQSPTYNL